MKRMKRSILVLTLAGLPLIPAGFAAAQSQTPAQQLCYIGGAGQCNRIQNNDDVLNNPIVNGNPINGSAENVTVSLSGNYMIFHFASGNCIGVSQATGNVVVKNCSGPDPGAYGTLWQQNGDSNLVNRAQTQAFGTDEDMTGGANGNRIFTGPPPQSHQSWGLDQAGPVSFK